MVMKEMVIPEYHLSQVGGAKNTSNASKSDREGFELTDEEMKQLKTHYSTDKVYCLR